MASAGPTWQVIWCLSVCCPDFPQDILRGMQIIQRSRLVLVWVLAFGLALSVWGIIIDVPNLLALIREHQEVSGTVVQELPSRHGLVDVRYEANGKAYQQALRPYGASSRTHDAVKVYFSSNNPEIAFMAPPQEVLKANTPFWLGGSLLFSIAVVLNFVLIQTKRGKYNIE
jgi:hypothetical protein